jgi:hypothetical protein
MRPPEANMVNSEPKSRPSRANKKNEGLLSFDSSDMEDQRPGGRHDAGRRSTQRWENEGGGIKHPPGMAGPGLDGLADAFATVEEHESRKRKLLKGPKEFRDMRRDHRR